MAAADVPPTRLEAARKSIREFLAKAPDTYRVGVVSFASVSRVVAPPTRDRELVELALTELRVGEGTALGDAIAKAVEVGQAAGRTGPGEEPTPTTVLLISDGKEDGGTITPQRASQTARSRGVSVHTVALGTADGVVEVPLAGGYTARVQVPPDPNTLRAIAQTTGGTFYAVPTAEQLQEVYSDLASQLGEEKEWREVTVAFAAGGALMLLVGGALSASWFRRLP
jgi:Ca-activated chloride channel family protein